MESESTRVQAVLFGSESHSANIPHVLSELIFNIVHERGELTSYRIKSIIIDKVSWSQLLRKVEGTYFQKFEL